jgi:hypothetical protein
LFSIEPRFSLPNSRPLRIAHAPGRRRSAPISIRLGFHGDK